MTPECLKLIGAFQRRRMLRQPVRRGSRRAAAIALRTGEMDLDAHGNPEMREKVKALSPGFRKRPAANCARM